MPTPAEIASTLLGFQAEISVMPESLDQTQKDRLEVIAGDLGTADTDVQELGASAARKKVVEGRIRTAEVICNIASSGGELPASDNKNCVGALTQAAGILNSL